MFNRRLISVLIWCVAAAVTLVAWTASYRQERFIVHDYAWETAGSGPVTPTNPQFFVIVDPSSVKGSGGPGLHHLYSALGSSQGEIFFGFADRFYRYISKSSWYAVVPQVKEGLNLLSKDLRLNTTSIPAMPSKLGFGAALESAPKDDLSPIELSHDWVSNFLEGCYGIFLTSGGDKFNVSFIVPYWSVALLSVGGLARSVRRWTRVRYRGFPVN